MNYTNCTLMQNIVNKLPVSIFFSQLPDRQQANNYLQWLINNVPEAQSISNQDPFLREIISKELRIINMKITETEILLMVGLNKITVGDFTIDSKSLIKKLIYENQDKNDLDIMYRIMAQIMTKLPRDLKERVTGKQKLEIFQKISQHINIDNALLEKFISFDPSINTPISMELNSGDYNTLNKKYLHELKSYEEEKGYTDGNSMEYATIATNMTIPETTQNNTIDAKYIDNQPDFMLGQNDNTLYYYDSSSGTLTDINLSNNQAPVSLKDLKTILSSNKVKKSDVQSLIRDLSTHNTIAQSNVVLKDSISTTTTEPSSFFNRLGSYFSSSSGNSTATATATTSSTSVVPDITNAPTTTTTENQNWCAPMPPQYIINQVNQKYSSQTMGGNPSGTPGGNPGGTPGVTLGGNPGGTPGVTLGGTSGGGNSGGVTPGGGTPGGVTPGGEVWYRGNGSGILSTRYGGSNEETGSVEYNKEPNKDNIYWTYSQQDDLIIDDSIPYTTVADVALAYEELQRDYVQSPISPELTNQSTENYEYFTSSMYAPNTPNNTPNNIPNNSISEDMFLKKIKNDNQNIENVALGFVSLIILLFLLVIFNSIRNNLGKK
jgi:hypothetical protein